MQTYCAVYDVTLTTWEIETILAIDQEALSIMNEQTKARVPRGN